MTFEGVDLLVGIMGVMAWACIAFALLWIVLMTVGKAFVWLLTWPWLAWWGWRERKAEGIGHKAQGRVWDFESDGV